MQNETKKEKKGVYKDGWKSTLKERAHQNESISGILHPVEDEDKEFKECEEKKRQREMKTDRAKHVQRSLCCPPT